MKRQDRRRLKLDKTVLRTLAPSALTAVRGGEGPPASFGWCSPYDPDPGHSGGDAA